MRQIVPKWDLEFKNLIEYKGLLYLLICDFVTSYKQTILGPFWVILQALIGSAVFTVVFGKIANIPTDGHPSFLFYLCGMLSWQYFAGVYYVGCNALQSNLPIFSKCISRLIPLSQSLFLVFNLVVQLIVLFLATYITRLNYPNTISALKLLPRLLLFDFAKCSAWSGMGFIISSVSVKYRIFPELLGWQLNS